jgi:uncharacterized protein YcfJ
MERIDETAYEEEDDDEMESTAGIEMEHDSMDAGDEKTIDMPEDRCESSGPGHPRGQDEGKVSGQDEGKVSGQGKGKVSGQGKGKVSGQGKGKAEEGGPVDKGVADHKIEKEKQERAVVRQEKKKRKLIELQESQTQFDMCAKGCKCNLENPCKMVGMIQC